MTLIDFEITPEAAILTTKASKRSDAGPYKVTLRNRYGQDSVKLNVNVLDRPGPPQGPIEPTDIEADAMTLSWLPPKDNGGDEIINYVVEKKDPKTGEWTKVSPHIPPHERTCIWILRIFEGWEANGHQLQSAKSARRCRLRVPSHG